jgi:hypothetical protein
MLISLQLFGLDANRKGRISLKTVFQVLIQREPRDLIVGDFVNWELKPVI